MFRHTTVTHSLTPDPNDGTINNDGQLCVHVPLFIYVYTLLPNEAVKIPCWHLITELLPHIKFVLFCMA